MDTLSRLSHDADADVSMVCFSTERIILDVIAQL